jgi:hypothetical protein
LVLYRLFPADSTVNVFYFIKFTTEIILVNAIPLITASDIDEIPPSSIIVRSAGLLPESRRHPKTVTFSKQRDTGIVGGMLLKEVVMVQGPPPIPPPPKPPPSLRPMASSSNIKLNSFDRSDENKMHASPMKAIDTFGGGREHLTLHEKSRRMGALDLRRLSRMGYHALVLVLN